MGLSFYEWLPVFVHIKVHIHRHVGDMIQIPVNGFTLFHCSKGGDDAPRNTTKRQQKARRKKTDGK